MTLLDKLGVREGTMRLALRLLDPYGDAIIVETGCARKDDEWAGDGLSTVVLGEWCAENDGHLTTVDANPDNLATARRLSADYADRIRYVHDDSVHYLESDEETLIDLLYLDSFDYPLMDLIQTVGVEGDFSEACDALRELGDDYLAEMYDDVIGDSQRHCEREIHAALPHLHDRSVVLIDDANLPGGGKARRARKVLTANGWTCIADAYQTLWVKS